VGKRKAVRWITPAAIATVTLFFEGCSAAQVVNTGGDTKCQDFTTQNQKSKTTRSARCARTRTAVKPNNLEITATRMSAVTYCQTAGTPDGKISEAPHG
jgi:acid stress chaperone HdeA